MRLSDLPAEAGEVASKGYAEYIKAREERDKDQEVERRFKEVLAARSAVFRRFTDIVTFFGEDREAHQKGRIKSLAIPIGKTEVPDMDGASTEQDVLVQISDLSTGAADRGLQGLGRKVKVVNAPNNTGGYELTTRDVPPGAKDDITISALTTVKGFDDSWLEALRTKGGQKFATVSLCGADGKPLSVTAMASGTSLHSEITIPALEKGHEDEVFLAKAAHIGSPIIGAFVSRIDMMAATRAALAETEEMKAIYAEFMEALGNHFPDGLHWINEKRMPANMRESGAWPEETYPYIPEATQEARDRALDRL